MGIYGALATAVSGLRAQSFALENISGNIANSQTTGYKRIETTFVDLIPDAPVKSQVPGAVIAQSRSTNNDKGDVISSSVDTYMALNGSGFFVVEEKVGQNDGTAVFGGASYYTRRGDFDVDKEGYLVNGAGYYLKGLPIDAATGNISGSVPQVIKLSNAFLPAQPTNRLDYQLNLPQLPKNAGYDSALPGSELLDPADYMALPADVPATATGGINTFAGADVPNTIFANGQTLSFTVGGVTRTYGFDDTGAAVAGADVTFDTDLAPNDTLTGLLASIEADLQALGGDFASATVGLNGGAMEVTLGANTTDSLTIGGTGGPASAGFAAGPFNPIDQSYLNQVAAINADDSDDFLSNSIAGGAITVFAENGSPVNVQLRWAKVASEVNGGVDRWNLFYLEDGNASGTDPMWRNAGTDYEFNAAGSLDPNIPSITIPNLQVNGIDIGEVTIQHNTGGVTQFANANGTAKVTQLSQNGYAAGEFISVTINDAGRVVASYTNGQQIELAAVVVANFNSPNSLKRMDGGLFAATSESGEAILDNGSGIIGGSLESSNTDISEEFTKLIVTQQAYAAGTRIVSTSNDMLQEALNMVR
ncbi:flagellar hook protein FlgE [Mariluticola halotolerans]|uniref:flagellar hook protein FlgE n=1 Tax=Mariluticola halotolerans TaxID=2909283 RepID=UPI0026E121B1|nr:flagellar hook-basal body complex protein [Mariluticola halotolerans]UJQ95433.1 flagellar hook-basal body complex protein [Mariluticola halotolerans]